MNDFGCFDFVMSARAPPAACWQPTDGIRRAFPCCCWKRASRRESVDPHTSWLRQTVQSRPSTALLHRTPNPAEQPRIGQPRGACSGDPVPSMGSSMFVASARISTLARTRQSGWAGRCIAVFHSSETSEGADDYHGVGGPLAVSDRVEPHPLCDAFIERASRGLCAQRHFNGARRRLWLLPVDHAQRFAL